MSDAPNASATSADFEFAALDQAGNYRRALVEEFSPWLRGCVVEVGAGIGQTSEAFAGIAAIERLVCVEPEPAFCGRLRQRVPAAEVIEGVAAGLPEGFDADAVVSVNVLEHIRDDGEELRVYRRLLAERNGALLLLTPARPEIYAPIDRDFGHFRRYRLPEMREKLARNGFDIARLRYYNWLGYFAWWWTFKVCGTRAFDPAKVRFYDRVLFPVVRWTETRLCSPPIGQSVLVVAVPGKR